MRCAAEGRISGRVLGESAPVPGSGGVEFYPELRSIHSVGPAGVYLELFGYPSAAPPSPRRGASVFHGRGRMYLASVRSVRRAGGCLELFRHPSAT